MPLALASHLSVQRVGNAVINALAPEAMLSLYLGAHPHLADALYYDGKHYHGTWPTWPDGLKKDLADRWAAMVTWYGQNMPSPDPPSFEDPLPRVNGDPSQNYDGFMMPAARGRHMYLSHVANGLALETTGKLPWSIIGYSAAHLTDLFTCEYWLIYLTPPDATIEGYYYEDLMSPATPAHVLRFLTANQLLGTSALDTVARLVGWCRILIHYFTTQAGVDPDIHAFWGPDAPPIPTSMMINGSNFTGYDPPQFGRYTYGCAGTAEFLKSVLRAVNIPVEVRTPPCGHEMPVFPTINRALSHGDDPYDQLWKVTPSDGWPVPTPEEVLITEHQYNQWFDPALDPNVMINNVARRPAELGVKYQSDWLLDRYCRDTTAGLDHASGEVYDSLKTYYTVSELEAKHLWDKLAAKATATNWCASPSGAAQPHPSRATPKVRVEPQILKRPRKA
jgi:hypothetical protein